MKLKSLVIAGIILLLGAPVFADTWDEVTQNQSISTEIAADQAAQPALPPDVMLDSKTLASTAAPAAESQPAAAVPEPVSDPSLGIAKQTTHTSKAKHAKKTAAKPDKAVKSREKNIKAEAKRIEKEKRTAKNEKREVKRLQAQLKLHQKKLNKLQKSIVADRSTRKRLERQLVNRKIAIAKADLTKLQHEKSHLEPTRKIASTKSSTMAR